jgi:hypothetical protein
MEKEADGQKEPADPAEKDSPEDAFYQTGE